MLAAFCMVPIVLFSTPETAAAATSDLVSITLPGPPGMDASCTVSTALTPVEDSASVLIVGAGSICKGGPDISPGYCQDFEPGCGSFELVVKGTGGECGSMALSNTSAGSGNGVFSVQTLLGGMSGNIGSCDPTEICLTYTREGWGSDTQSVGCGPSLLDPPDPLANAATCLDGGFASEPSFASQTIKPDPANPQTHWVLEGPVRANAGLPTTPRPDWGAYVLYTVWKNVSVGVSKPTATMGDVRLQYWAKPAPPGVRLDWDFTWRMGNSYHDKAFIEQQQADDLLIGYGYYPAKSTVFQDTEAPAAVPGAFGGAFQTGALGITDPSRCLYYWGQKIAVLNDPTATADDPIGPASTTDPTAPVEPTEPPAVPVAEPEDIPDDTNGLLGWLAELLRALIRAVQSLAQAIVDGIRGMLNAVFVPSDGFLDSRAATLQTNWEKTSPAKYADAVSDFTVGSSSGCGGMPLNLTLPGGVEVNQSIGAACSGPMASSASIVRTVLSAVFVIGGLFACVRAVGSGLGWDPGVGKGAGA